jgi:acid phosphatase type 7
MATTTKNPVPNVLQPGAVRARHTSKNSQANEGVSPLDPVAKRNMSFQPLPPPLGLPPYHYSLTDNFPAIGSNFPSSI